MDYLSKAKDIYTQHTSDNGGITYSEQSDYPMFRLFAKGDQPVDRYKQFFSKFSDEDRKGFRNVLFDVLSPANKIVSRILGHLDKFGGQIQIDTIDPSSIAEEEERAIMSWVKKVFNQELYDAYKMAGIDPPQDQFIPENQDEVKIYKEMGGFKAAHAKNLETLLVHTDDISSYNVNKSLWNRDLISIGVIGCYDYLDPEDGKIKTKYVDPYEAGVQYSRYQNFKDATWAFHTELMAESELLLYPEVKKDDLIRPVYPDKTYSRYNYLPRDKFAVMHFEFIDMKGKIRTRYKGSWIIGTDRVFDCGEDYDIVRKTKGTVLLRHHFYKLETKSIIAQIYPVLDQYEIIFNQWQNFMGSVIKAGYAIDIDSINAVQVGKDKISSLKVLKRFFDTGILFFSTKNAFGQRENRIPITNLPGNYGQQMAEISAAFAQANQLIEQVTGFSPVMFGAAGAASTAVGVNEASLAGASDSLSNMVKALNQLRLDTAENVARMIVIQIKSGSNSYDDIIGKEDVIKIKKAAESHCKYGLKMTLLPNQLERQALMEAAQTELRNNRDGKPGLTYPDYINIINSLSSGKPLKEIEFYFNKALEKRKREYDITTQNNIAYQANEQAKAQQQAIFLESQMIKIKGIEERKTKLLELIPVLAKEGKETAQILTELEMIKQSYENTDQQGGVVPDNRPQQG